MSDTPEDKSDDRPSTSELLGTSPEQVKRQGKAKEGPGTNQSTPTQEEGGRLYQSFIGTASIILLVLGIVVLGLWINYITSQPEPEPAPAITPPDIFYVENAKKLRLATTTELSTQINNAFTSITVEEGPFTQLYFTETRNKQEYLVTTDRLFSYLSGDGTSVERYLGNKFMYGQFMNKDEAGRYLVFPVQNYEGAYGSLLQTEESLAKSLEPLGFLATSTFQDTIIQNQDVRFATTTETSGFYYALPLKEHLVITTDETTLRAIFDRLD